jgi:DNA-binding XRE family transcriptional regulator
MVEPCLGRATLVHVRNGLRDILCNYDLAATLPTPSEARGLRRSVGASQEHLAAELGVHRSTVSRIESGALTPRNDVLRRYVAVIEELRKAAKRRRPGLGPGRTEKATSRRRHRET